MMLTSIAQAESPRHDGIALTPVYAHQRKVKNIYTWTASHVSTHMYTTLGTQLLHQPQCQWLSFRLLFRCEFSTRLDVSCLLVRHLTISFFLVALLLSVFRSPLTICLSLHSCLSIPLCTVLLMKVVLGSNKTAAFQLGDLFLASHCFREGFFSFFEYEVSDIAWETKSSTYLLPFKHGAVPYWRHLRRKSCSCRCTVQSVPTRIVPFGGISNICSKI